jgi:hypothetical protein
MPERQKSFRGRDGDGDAGIGADEGTGMGEDPGECGALAAPGPGKRYEEAAARYGGIDGVDRERSRVFTREAPLACLGCRGNIRSGPGGQTFFAH